MSTNAPSPPPVPPASGPTASAPPPLPQTPDSDERTWAVLAHVSYFVLGIIGPVVIMYCHESFIKRRSKFVYHHAKQALVYQIAIIALVLIAIGLTIVTCGIGVPLVFVVAFGGMVFPILAACAAGRNEWYVYPLQESFVD